MENLQAIKLKIASPDDILKWSHGEIIKPETINYRTQRPEKDGLFSERIFGPTKDWECYCGKYRRIRYKGIVCDRCGVEVTRSVVRRERMGHIKLATPVAHIWFLRSSPSKLSLLLDVPLPKLEKVIYYISYIITSLNEDNKERVLKELEKEFEARKKTARKEGVKTAELRSGLSESKKEVELLKMGTILNQTEYYNLARKYGDVFEAGTGAEAIRKILSQIDLDKLAKEIEKGLETSKDTISERRLLKRLKIVRAMAKEDMRPEWMILDVLPVLPPDLRPMVALDGGRYATSDLNDLYRRVINRNNRLKKLLELNAPDVIIVNEKRMLQEAVDALIDNSARFGTQQMSSQRRPLQSMADQLKGKTGRFRQNLLGKRVDYSGRSVIVIGPDLKLHECGLPKKMALELFKPFVINKVIERGLAHNIRNSNRLIEQAPPEIWAILEEVIADRKVLLNRAPTLHRLGVQAFKPVLIEDLAIRIPPMVCTAFNADFDGDQMAVHLPLSAEAQKEASEIMLSSRNLLKPATGDPIVYPTNDIVLGIYYLNKLKKDARGAGMQFSGPEEVTVAYENGVIDVNAPIMVVIDGGKIETSCGRILFNDILPEDFEFVNRMLRKKDITALVGELIHRYGNEKSSAYLDSMKKLGFEYATRSGITWSMGDLTTPGDKPALLAKAEEEITNIRQQYEDGLLTEPERRTRVLSVWANTKDALSKLVPKSLSEHNPIYSIIDSGSRGSWAQPVQMIGMKGLVANPKNEIIELPVKSSLKEGLGVLEYFISTHGARKGTTDTALKTASAGYLTRRLIDVSQDLVICEEDCKTKEGIEITRSEGMQFGLNFADQVFSRTALEDIKVDGKTVVKAGEIIDKKTAGVLQQSKVEEVKVRSPITCKTLYGLCSGCYGFDLGNNQSIKMGAAVGIVAAQSIGEPGTQLTMRTFHTGGVAGADITHGLPRVEELFECRPPKGRAYLAEEEGIIDGIEDKGLLKVIRLKAFGKTKKEKVYEYLVPRLTILFVKIGDPVKKGDQLCEGALDLKDLFILRGSRAVEKYVINEVLRIYNSEGSSMNNKHIEIIVRQMFSRVKIKESGDTDFVRGEIIEKSKFLEINREMKKAGKQPAKAQQLLLGITKVALSTQSFLSAASFQETARVLITAASEGKVDVLRGLKENVIIGKLIPVGTGYSALGGEVAEDVSEDAE
ncbi:MAG: DNA-directed RNA polymerase subunit beta' [Candidatus Harrisonbacteria bacterium]|nr:DNA-directed RNA polymerase subunit beta' [Candidatus Harrisonbacteria bacterium]